MLIMTVITLDTLHTRASLDTSGLCWD